MYIVGLCAAKIRAHCIYHRMKHTVGKRSKIFFVPLAFALLLLVLYMYGMDDKSTQITLQPKDTRQDMKVILLWTTYFTHDDFFLGGFGQDPFIKAGCKVNNCRTTNNKSENHLADAVIFHVRDVDTHTVLPTNRKANQRYVFFLVEHPFFQWNDLRLWGGFFNLTMTYRHDSDIPLPYGRTDPLGAPLPADQRFDLTARAGTKDDRKLIAWFVSNCKSDSKREEYVKELQKYIPVDIYGKCGPLECPERNDIKDKRQHPDCLKMVERKYKFYLSFENIHCKEYVTEKLWHILNLDTVPIVMGGADYKTVAPPHSVINVDDFKSPKQLADYLHHLNTSPEEYWSYKAWRNTHRVLELRPVYLDAFCHLCEVLNDPTQNRKQYDDIHKWWGKDTDCDLHVVDRMKASWT